MSVFCEGNHTAIKSGTRKKYGFQVWSSLWSQSAVLYIFLICPFSHYHKQLYYLHLLFSNFFFKLCHSHLQQIILSSSWHRKHNSFRQNFLKALFSYVNTSTYLRPFYHRKWDVHFLPKASPAIHIFHPLRSLLCQSALLLPSASSPFGVLPSAYDIFKPLPCEKASPFSTLCLS